MSINELVQKTYRDIQKKKAEKEKGKKAATSLSIENMYRVRKREYHSRQNKISRY